MKPLQPDESDYTYNLVTQTEAGDRPLKLCLIKLIKIVIYLLHRQRPVIGH